MENKYSVEKYRNEKAFMDGSPTSCKFFDNYNKALSYARKKAKSYKKGFLSVWVNPLTSKAIEKKVIKCGKIKGRIRYLRIL